MKKSISLLILLCILSASQVYASDTQTDDINDLLTRSMLLREELADNYPKEKLKKNAPFTEIYEDKYSFENVESKPSVHNFENIESQEDDLISRSERLRADLDSLYADESYAGEDEKEIERIEKEVYAPLGSDETENQNEMASSARDYEEDKTLYSETKDDDRFFKETFDASSNVEIYENPRPSEESYSGSDCAVFDYRPDTVNDVFVKPGFITDVILPFGEAIQRVTLGDSLMFDVKTYADFSGDGSNHVYVNPLQKNIETNMIITTDRRNYQLRLMSGELHFPFVRWKLSNAVHYSQSNQMIVHNSSPLALEVESVKDLYFDYARSAKAKYKWAPSNVFDDKYWNTYFVFEHGRLSSISPMIFIETRGGSLEMAPYDKSGDTIVLRRVCSDLLMVNGNDSIKFHRKKSL